MSTSKLRVLIIEDNPADEKLLREYLSGLNGTDYIFKNAYRLSDGLKILSEDKSIDVILLDLGLPDINVPGSLVEMIIKNPYTAVIVLSGTDDLNNSFKALDKGTQDYLVKGHFGAELLRRSIKYAIERKKSEKEIIESRDRLSLKLDSILSLNFNLEKSELGNVLNIKEMKIFLEGFYELTNIGVAIVDLEGNILVATGWQDICTNFHRVNEQSCKNCIESDLYLTKNVKKGEFVLYKCKNNMWDMASPIIIGEKHIGNIYLGQFFFDDEKVENSLFEKQALQYGFDKDKYMEALGKVPRWSRKKVDDAMKFYSRFAEMISNLSFSNIKLARTLLDHKLSEEKLKKSEEKYRLIFENSADGIYITTIDGNYVDVNNALVKMLGYNSKKELMSLNVKKNLYLSEDERPGPENRNCMFEAGLKKKDGNIIYAQINSTVEYENGKPKYYRGIVRDVTEKVQFQHKLEKVAREWNVTFDSMKDSISITDTQGKILRANKSMMQLLGKNYTDMLGKKCKNFLGAAVHPKENCLLEKVHISKKRERRVGRFKDKYILCIVEPILDEDRNLTGAVHIISDITEQKLAEKSIKDNLARIKKTFSQTVDTLSRLVEVRDPYTAGHQKRVAVIATAIARDMGLSRDNVEAIKLSALIHDIGKISVPASILSKPGMITDIERVMIETHPSTGYEIVREIDFPFPIADIILQHHEKLDGSGYPNGLKSGQIMIGAKIIAVADVFEAMTAHRPYRGAFPKKTAFDQISKNRGILYDTDAVNSCIKLFVDKEYSKKNKAKKVVAN